MVLRDAARLPSLLPGGVRDGARALRLGQHGRAAGPPSPIPPRKVEGNHAIWIALAAALTLAGCVGSDDNPPDVAETHPSVVVRLDPGSFQHAVSAYRQAHGLSPVAIDPGLMALAQSQANVMARSNHLSHEIAGSLDQRLNAAHHTKGYAVENVSAGYATADAALVGWEHSPGHNLNLLDKKMRRLGIAAADAPGTRFKTYWALMMTD